VHLSNFGALVSIILTYLTFGDHDGMMNDDEDVDPAHPHFQDIIINDRYRVEYKIAEGGFGLIYAGELKVARTG
jgi:hypothetical protein